MPYRDVTATTHTAVDEIWLRLCHGVVACTTALQCITRGVTKRLANPNVNSAQKVSILPILTVVQGHIANL